MQPERNIAACKNLLLEHWPEIRFSSVYNSDPREYEKQNQFLNAVATVNTKESPEEVVQVLRGAETALKKDPPFKYGPRTIDLDLLLFGNTVLPSRGEWMQSNKLQATYYKLMIPHPRMHERRFVLEPLCELIDPESTHPTLEIAWKDLLDAVKDQICTHAQETH